MGVGDGKRMRFESRLVNVPIRSTDVSNYAG